MDNGYYVIVVCERDKKSPEREQVKYLFDTKCLVTDIALARRFNNLTPANRYLAKSVFSDTTHYHFYIEYIAPPEPEFDPHRPGSLVE